MKNPSANITKTPGHRTVGQQIITIYRGVAILTLNTLILLILVEGGSNIILDLRLKDFVKSWASAPYYTTKEWATEYWQESEVVLKKTHYHPYVIWRRGEFNGTTITIDQNGLRRTPGVDCGPDSYTVFAFGGSTMWGFGSPGASTIPAYLQKGLETLKDKPICVMNFGEPGFVSTQSLIQLLTELQSEHVPDVVIFYDGINDVLSAYQFGRSDVHLNFDYITTELESEDRAFVKLLKASNSFAVLRRVVARVRPISYQTMGIDTDDLADSITQTYLSNYKIANALAREYGFKVFFFWQPIISVHTKPLTEYEQTLRDDMDPAVVNLYNKVYQNIEIVASDYESLYYIAQVLRDYEDSVWLDEYHVTPTGNELIAQKMLEIIEGQIGTEN